MTTAPPEKPGFLTKWSIYQKERFPVLQHGLLIIAFSSSAVAYSAMLCKDSAPAWQAFLVAFTTCFIFFLQLRIADEFKDIEEDTRYRPYRPVPRGLISLRELGWLFALGASIQLGLALLYFPPLVYVLLIGWVYLSLMSVEFFARDWLKARPITYLWTHMLIMPIVDFYATACHWYPSGNKPYLGLAFFLAASFFNGIVIEIGRKLRQPADEEAGVPTYSKLWGKKAASLVWLGSLTCTLLFAILAANLINWILPLAISLGILLLISLVASVRFYRSDRSGKVFETISGLWTLALYLNLGLLPFWSLQP
ncbi:hypothetical protein Rhal01_01149 [Rubritalea halochordaticola]|uniref:Manganese transporter permease n=1 Tax=Rubritalea halochordaticola TaxID=714537 RepID=A0ABP9UZ33_9BACT